VSVSHRWVSFDCFGTLVDWQAWFTEVLGPLGGPAVVRAYHAQERVIEHESPQRSYKDVLATALVRATAESGVRLSHNDARAMLIDAWGAMRLFDDVEVMLAELRSKGHRLAVLTNCDEDLFATTHRLFAKPFDLCLTSERVRGYKPEPWHFRGFELLTGVSRQRWVHVANSWYHDIAPARALGLNHLWLDRERTGADAAASVDAGASVRVHVGLEIAGIVERLVEDGSSLVFGNRSTVAAGA